MLESLRLWPVLAGARGRPLTVDAVVDALVRLSWLGCDLGPRLAELDVNPLAVGVSGVVALGLGDEAAVRAAWRRIRADVRGKTGIEVEAGLVAAMAKAEAELILGLRFDAQFGPMVLAGFGGVFAELVADTAIA